MINGVTVLASEVVMTSSTLGNALFGLCVLIAIIGFFCFLIGGIFDILPLAIGGVITIGASFAFGLLVCLPIDSITKVPDYTKYEVIIDDSISIGEFMNTYEVLEQRGHIYVVKEIEK